MQRDASASFYLLVPEIFFFPVVEAEVFLAVEEAFLAEEVLPEEEVLPLEDVFPVVVEVFFFFFLAVVVVEAVSVVVSTSSPDVSVETRLVRSDSRPPPELL